MFDRTFTSEEEIAKVYADHIDSLKSSGLPFDEEGIRAEWREALRNFREAKTSPPWLTESL